jgi:hypothetical protein
MGTKNNPGKFDCYATADPDEPIFVLLGRDPLAGALVRVWASLRREMFADARSDEKAREANAVAETMDSWCRRHGIGPIDRIDLNMIVRLAYGADRPVILGNDPRDCNHFYPTTRDGRCHGCGKSRAAIDAVAARKPKSL